MPNVLQAKSQGAGGILESMKHFPEFSSYVNNESNNLAEDAQGDTQLLLMYHRLPYEMKEINGTEKKVSPKSPNGIIPSLLGFFSNGRTGAQITGKKYATKKPHVPTGILMKINIQTFLLPVFHSPKKKLKFFINYFPKKRFGR